MIKEAGHAKHGVWVFSTQFFPFGNTPGAQTLVSQGYELADIGVAISRAITGGTGEYTDARGASEQTLLGFNQSEGVNLRVKLNVRMRYGFSRWRRHNHGTAICSLLQED